MSENPRFGGGIGRVGIFFLGKLGYWGGWGMWDVFMYVVVELVLAACYDDLI